MEITFLGTAASEGWPGIFCDCKNCLRAIDAGGKNIRTRTSFLLDRALLIDPGLDLPIHVHRYNLRLSRLAGMLITHAHPDHLSADEFRYTIPPFSLRDLSTPLPICGPADALDKIRDALGMDNDEAIRREAGLELRSSVAMETFTIGRHEVTPLPAAHAPDLECFIYCVASRGKAYLQANDTGYFPDETWRWLEGRQMHAVSLDCTNGVLDDRSTHMGVSAVVDVVVRMRKEGMLAHGARAVATHFSHNGGLVHHELEEAFKPHDIEVGYDGMIVEV